MLLGILLTVLVSVVLDRIWVFVSAALVTVDLALLLNGLNPLTLMIISVLLIAGVVWRLLARDQGPSADKQAPALPQNPYQARLPDSFLQMLHPHLMDRRHGLGSNLTKAITSPMVRRSIRGTHNSTTIRTEIFKPRIFLMF